MQPVRLVLLMLDGPQEGENDFVEFPSIEAAIAYGRDLCGDPRCQLEGIEDPSGRLLVGFDHLNDLCSAPESMLARKYG